MIENKLNKYIFPNIFAMLGISLYILADTFFISVSDGANGITALNLTLPIYGVMYAIGAMFGTGSATRYAISKANRLADYQDYFSNSIIWSVIVSLVFVAMGVFIPHKVLALMGADEIILNTGIDYLRVAMIFAPCFIVNYTLTSFVRNDGAPNVAMLATIISSLFNILFDYVLMFPFGMGMLGAALATGLSPIVSMSICMFHFMSKKNTIVFVKKVPSIKKLLKSAELGIAGFIGEISNGITNLVFNFVLLALVGNIGVAAYGVVANVSIVGFAIFSGIAQGLQPMASQASGEHDDVAQRTIKRHSLLIGIAAAMILMLLSCFFAEHIVSAYNSEGSTEMQSHAVVGLRIYVIGFLLAAINIINAGYYSAIGKSFECSVVSILRGVVLIVVFALLLPIFFDVYGVWLAFPVAELFTLAVTFFLDKKAI